MNKIDKVKIDGFWLDKSVKFSLKDDVNFLIGVNGSGKTTIINLIAATLNANFSALDNIQFEKIRITLKSKKINSVSKNAFIEVEKEEKDTSPYPKIVFRIKGYENKTPKEFDLDEIEEDRFIRRDNRLFIRHRAHRNERYTRDVSTALQELISITWLSVNRVNLSNRRQEDIGSGSIIDLKIDELQNELIKYFSQLSGKCTTETNDFQKYIFQSLLDSDSKDSLYDSALSAAKSIKLDDEKQSLRDIFIHFNLNDKKTNEKLEKSFESFTKAISGSNVPGLSAEDFGRLLNMVRVHSVVQEWSKLIKKQEDINKPKDIFLKVINNLLQRKKLIINEKNELIVETESGKHFFLNKLSSGEKQLLIILGQSLLQESGTHIYIADEPELSLHVDWQEKLVSSLKEINPNSQIIFATHSPDIVGEFSSSIIKIEEVIS